MAEQKNILMKEYNGTDYDILYPTTLSKFVDGAWDLSNVVGVLDIEHGGTSGVMKSQYSQYVGTGTTSLTLTFDFKPSCVFISRVTTSNVSQSAYMLLDQQIFSDLQYTISNLKYISTTLTWNNNTLTLTTTTQDSRDAFNEAGIWYAYVAFATVGDTNYKTQLITESGIFVVPETASYYIELHGGGGGGYNGGSTESLYCGGSSGQYYSGVQLTAGDVINVTIGAGGKSLYGNVATTNGGATSFGNYSVDGGGRGWNSTASGKGAGNFGKDWVSGSGYVVYSEGFVGDKYGYGGYALSQSTGGEHDGGPGAVYLRWASNEST